MDDAEDHEKKTRAQRKRKVVSASESDKELTADTNPNVSLSDSSDDLYAPAALLTSSSDDDKDIKKISKKLKPSSSNSNNTKKKPRQAARQTRKKRVRHRRRLKTAGEKVEKEAEIPVLNKRNNQKPFKGRTRIVCDWYIASGFVKDLTALFKAFSSLDSWRFSAFATCWQNLKFSLVYRGRDSFKELLEFTEEICFWTKKFTSPIHDSKWRVGALYALYGLYYKHPIKNVCKIRLEVEEYENLENLARSFQNSAENPDPAYIFYKLKADGAFYYVATSEEMGHNFYKPSRQQDTMKYEIQWVLHAHSANTIFPEEDRIIQKTLIEEYENVKSQLCRDGSESDKRMSYLKAGIMSEVDAILAGLKDSQDQPNPVHTIHEEPDIGQKRQFIRERAAGLSTTDNFLNRKLLRSPRKNSLRDSTSLEMSPGGFSGNEIQEDPDSVPDDKILILRQIMEGMQPRNKGTRNKSLSSKKISRNEKPQKCLQSNDATTSGYSVNEGLQDILLPNESCRQKHDNYLLPNNAVKREHNPEYEENISPVEQNGLMQNPGSCSNLKEAGSKKPRYKKILPLKDKKKKLQKSELRNVRFPFIKTPQVLQETDPLSEENRPENKLMETVLRAFCSGDKAKESDSTQGAAMCEDIVVKPKNISLFQMRKRGRPKKTKLKKDVSKLKPTEYDSETDEDVSVDIKPPEEMVVMIQNPMELKNRGSEHIEENCPEHDSVPAETQVSSSREWIVIGKHCVSSCSETEETDYSRKTVEKNITMSDDVCEGDQVVAETVCTTYSDAAVASSESVSMGDNDRGVIPSEDNCQNTCDQVESGGPLSDNPHCNSNLHTVNNKQTDTEVSSRENSNPQRTVMSVKMSARLLKNEDLQVSEVMFLLHINFQVENDILQSTSVLISREDLLAIYNDEKKLERLRTEMYSFLPPEYKNHDLVLELSIHDSAFEGSGTSALESPEQGTQCTPEEESLIQDPQLTAGNVHELHEDEAVNTTVTKCKEINNDMKSVCTENIAEKVSHQGTSASPVSDQAKHKSVPHNVNKNLVLSNSEPQETPDDMNSVENVINVEVSARMPKKKHRQSALKEGGMPIVQISFFFKNVLIHSRKLKMDKKDLEAIHNDEAKLQKMKKKFQSFLPPKYKNHEMLIRLTVHDIIFNKSETSISGKSKQDR